MISQRLLLVLWITGRCNLSCRYCYAAGKSSGEDMELKTALAAIQKFSHLPLTIQFTGGEPMLRPEIMEQIVRWTRERQLDIHIQMQTNGTCIGPREARWIRERGIAVGISLDGLPETNEPLRGSTLKVLQGIQHLGQQGVMVNLNAVVTARNVEQLPGLVDFAWYLGNVGGIGLDLLRRSGRGETLYDSMRPSTEQLEKALEDMEARSRRLYEVSGRQVVIREIQEAKKRWNHRGGKLPYCYASCGKSAVVLPDGSCYPCGSLGGKEAYYMGSVWGDISLLELKSGISPKCGTCRYRDVCPGGCPSRVLLNQDAELDCALKKKAFQIVEKKECLS